MTAQDELRQAIQMMQNGQTDAAAKQLNRLANSPALDAKARAAAWVWLAESRGERDFKLRCLERALEYEPDNSQIRQGLQQLRAAPAQPSHLPLMRHDRERARQLQRTPRVVGVDGGANGLSSAAFIGDDGLLATTSYAVGGALQVAVHIADEAAMRGDIVRRYPQHDLALIATPLRLARKPAIAPPGSNGVNMPVTAYSDTGARLRGQLTRSDPDLPAQWLATNLYLIQLPDAGGNPLYDAQGQVIGLLTRNSDSRGRALAVNIAHILALAEALRREGQLLPQARCCAACGSLAQAAYYGGTACENCGAALPSDTRRAPDRDALLQLYGEKEAQTCVHCRASVGSYDGRCLRCGQTQASRAAAGA